MRVQTVETKTLGGYQKQDLCQSCSTDVESMLQSNAQYCYAENIFNSIGNWHEGICEAHEYHQACLDRRFRHS